MLYWKYSANCIYFINEYWIFVPAGLISNYFIIRKMRSNKKKAEQLKKLRDQLRRERKIRRIFYLTFALSGCVHLLPRGGTGFTDDFVGEDIIDVGYIYDQCHQIKDGGNFLDNDRLRNIVVDLYSHKRRGKIIYITATALCHLVQHYGQSFFSFQVAIGDFGITSLYQAVRKFTTIVLLSAAPPLAYAGNLMWVCIVTALGCFVGTSNLDSIEMSPIPMLSPDEELQPRIPGKDEMVVLNYRKQANKITMEKTMESKQCWLTDQALFNPTCKADKAAQAIESVTPSFNYNEVVNMKDSTQWVNSEFNDYLDIGQVEPSIPKPNLRRGTGKTVNFLEKFRDPDVVTESEKWDISESDVPKNLRTRTK